MEPLWRCPIACRVVGGVAATAPKLGILGGLPATGRLATPLALATNPRVTRVELLNPAKPLVVASSRWSRAPEGRPKWHLARPKCRLNASIRRISGSIRRISGSIRRIRRSIRRIRRSIRRIRQSIRRIRQSIRRIRRSIRRIRRSIRRIRRSIRRIRQSIRPISGLIRWIRRPIRRISGSIRRIKRPIRGTAPTRPSGSRHSPPKRVQCVPQVRAEARRQPQATNPRGSPPGSSHSRSTPRRSSYFSHSNASPAPPVARVRPGDGWGGRVGPAARRQATDDNPRKRNRIPHNSHPARWGDRSHPAHRGPATRHPKRVQRVPRVRAGGPQPAAGDEPKREPSGKIALSLHPTTKFVFNSFERVARASGCASASGRWVGWEGGSRRAQAGDR